MKIATNLPDEVVRVRFTAYQRVPGKGKGHLSSRYTKSITLVETTLQETFDVIEAALIGYCESGGNKEVNLEKKYVLTVLGGGPGYTLSDSDMWGIRDALYHCLDDGYLDQNKEWGEAMVEKINTLRHGEEDEED